MFVFSPTPPEHQWVPTQTRKQPALVALYPGVKRTMGEGNHSPQSYDRAENWRKSPCPLYAFLS